MQLQASENRNKGDGVDGIDGNCPEIVDSAIGETLCELGVLTCRTPRGSYIPRGALRTILQLETLLEDFEMLEDRSCINELAGLGRAFEVQGDCEILALLGFWIKRELFSVVADAVVVAVVVAHSRLDRGEDGTVEDIDARGEVADVCCDKVF
jgi:hypothetical protein